MIQVTSLLLGFFVFYKMFENRHIPYLCFLWFICPYILLNSNIIISRAPLPYLPVRSWLVFSYAAVHLFNIERCRLNWHYFPYKYGYLIFAIGIFFLGFMDSRLTLIDKIYVPFRYLLDNFLALFLGFVSIKNLRDFERILKPLYFLLLAFSIFGIYNYISQSNFYYSAVINLYMDKINSVDLEMARNRLEIVGDRYRALSVFQYSFTYGLVSSLFSLFFIYVFGFWPKYKQYGIIGFIAGGIGVVLSFSRTVFLSYCIGLLFFVLLAYDIGKILKYFVVCIITLSITYLISPTFEQNVNNAVGIFSGGESVGGNSSSVEMREIQFLGAFRYFLQNPVFGNGFGYIDQELGWADKTRNEYDLEMQGFESLVYQLMIEQGIVGLILCCFLGVLILLFAFKRLKYSEIRGESSLLISLFLTFFVFAVGTGPLGNWEITLLFIGLLTKLALLTRAYLWKKQSRLGGKNNKKQYAY